MNLKKLVSIFLGIILSFVILYTGIQISNMIEHGIGFALAILSIPAIGYYLYKNKNKYIGLGMLIISAPIFFFGFIFFLEVGF